MGKVESDMDEARRPTDRPSTRAAVAVLAALLAVVGGAAYGIHLLQQHVDANRIWHEQHDVVKTPRGGCLKKVTIAPDGHERGFERVDCTRPDAAYVVLHREVGHGDVCPAVVGAIAAVSTSDPDIKPPANDIVYLCLGRPGADRTAAIQSVTAGHCVRAVGKLALPTPCTMQGAAKVLRIARDVSLGTINDRYLKSSIIQVCGESLATSTDSLFTWRLAREGEQFGQWDIVLCLGKPLP